jgi:CRP-like cAMP-binding protein
MKRKTFVKNQSIFKEGDIVDGIYFVVSGNLRYQKSVPYE